MNTDIICTRCSTHHHLYEIDKDEAHLEKGEPLYGCRNCRNEEFFIVDKDIATHIAFLNSRGYGTFMSCSGHVEINKDGIPFYSSGYIAFDKKYPEINELLSKVTCITMDDSEYRTVIRWRQSVDKESDKNFAEVYSELIKTHGDILSTLLNYLWVLDEINGKRKIRGIGLYDLAIKREYELKWKSDHD